MAEPSDTIIQSLINHVAFPPNLPSKQESGDDTVEINESLVDLLLGASKTLRNQTRDSLSAEWEQIRFILQTCKSLNRGCKLDKTSLLDHFRAIEFNRPLILHVANQNAGLIVRRTNDSGTDVVIFEAFELSPLSEEALRAELALECTFPGVAVAVDYSSFESISFQDALADFLERASTELIFQFLPKVHKAGVSTAETRDTADPSLITQILMTLLEAYGRRTYPPALRKRVYDDVCWHDGAQNPWRRSPYWLLLRVGIQRHLFLQHGKVIGRVYYKFLVGVALQTILEESIKSKVGPECLNFLKAKLARRLAKLEAGKEVAPSKVRLAYDANFLALRPVSQRTMRNADERIQSAWESFKYSTQRVIIPLPSRAAMQDLAMSLPNSRAHLSMMLSEHKNLRFVRQRPQILRPQNFDVTVVTQHSFREFSRQYFDLFQSEQELAARYIENVSRVTVPRDDVCIQIASKIRFHLACSTAVCHKSPEQKSADILLIMELWMKMDQHATGLIKLLLDYNPGFPTNMTDVLHLSSRKDMARLHRVDEHLRFRHSRCQSSQFTIFEDLTKGCFAERYFDGSSKLQALRSKIEHQAALDEQKKRDELAVKTAEYEDLSEQISKGACTRRADANGDLKHDEGRCRRCYQTRVRRRLKIEICENPLPSRDIAAKGVVFELDCPQIFSVYRDTTWAILSNLTFAQNAAPVKPKIRLPDYVGVKAFWTSNRRDISLASTAKLFGDTHYSKRKLPVPIDDVLKPNGLILGYHDNLSGIWVGRQTQTPSIAHHCHLELPVRSPFSTLQTSVELSTEFDQPTSYEVIAGQHACPEGLNMHEYTSYRSLLAGQRRRWPSILIELGSANLNFSIEAVSMLMSQITLQAGPADPSDCLRNVHSIFRNSHFVERLMEQIDQRLQSISANWRETNCMDMLITLILRCHSIAPKIVSQQALVLVQKARTITSRWTSELRTEIRRSGDMKTARTCSKYALWAAIQCKRTFSILLDDLAPEETRKYLTASLEYFIESSITIQDNLSEDPVKSSPPLKNAMIRDLKLTYRLRHLLRESLLSNPAPFYSAINRIWPLPPGSFRSYSDLKAIQGPVGDTSDSWWINSVTGASDTLASQSIHYHLLEGHLFVDNKPIGKLPAEHRGSESLKHLFKNENLMTFPSGLHGMTYVVAHPIDGHQIHIGFSPRGMIIKACFKDTILQMVHPSVFGDAKGFDLPASLVEDCVHWLDLHSGVLEIRPMNEQWKRRPKSNWFLDLKTYQVTRGAAGHSKYLVDPNSALCQKISRNFADFELPFHLRATQPRNGRLKVELRRQDLSFFVNFKGLLECHQLGAVIDLDQDAGTLYGLRSMIVLKDAKNPSRRSLIVPTGDLTSSRNHIHVNVYVSNIGQYCRYTINDVLGRLESPTEPKLLYMKAQFHAYTSFVVPDRLTGRTGTEEALHCLRSGYCQPWTPLTLAPYQVLHRIAALTPTRQYYPPKRGVMQQIAWNPDLTFHMQHNDLRPVVRAILAKSNSLAMFALNKAELPTIELCEPSHLTRRAALRSRLFQRECSYAEEQRQGQDLVHTARGVEERNQARSHVYEVASLLLQKPTNIATSSDLAGILQSWPEIRGFGYRFESAVLSDLLGLQIELQWGPLINLCRSSGPNETIALMFTLGPVVYRQDVEMTLIRTLIAFAVLEPLKQLQTPEGPSYQDYRQNEGPSKRSLMPLIQPFGRPYPGPDSNSHNLNRKEQARRRAAEVAHEEGVTRDCHAIVLSLLQQWPREAPDMSTIDTTVQVDMKRAKAMIIPEWKRLFHNRELSNYLYTVQQILNQSRTKETIKLPITCVNDSGLQRTEDDGYTLPTLSRDLLCKACWPISSEAKAPTSKQILPFRPSSNRQKLVPVSPSKAGNQVASGHAIRELEQIVQNVMSSQNMVQQQYGRDLYQSLSALKTIKGRTSAIGVPVSEMQAQDKINEARSLLKSQFAHLCKELERDNPQAQWLKLGGLWPCVTHITLLEELRSTSHTNFGKGMKDNVMAFAIAITSLQRWMRIADAHRKADAQKMDSEQANSGHNSWSPVDNPDWLLLEIESDIMIRKDQVDVARATIEPSSGSNSVLQMNMGQGKTSCIMPMAAAVLADSKNLMRVVVPKALLLQTTQTLQSRIGGLIGRELTHIPFSRKTSTKPRVIKAFFDIHDKIKTSSGVVVAIPEHLLSFMLSGLQRISDERISESNPMIKAQSWLREHARDVLDECDYTLAVRTQLIYPSGSQRTVDGHPHRWETAEILLQLVDQHLWGLQKDYPHSLEISRKPEGGFPLTYFLRKDVEDALIERLVADIIQGRTSLLPSKDLSDVDRDMVKQFITATRVEPECDQRISDLFVENPVAFQTMYLLRGLFVHQILLLTLKKRWNVQYGLHPARDPVAVPFHAKGVPSDQAEWGHPDVAILFTCLSFYHTGLTRTQLRQSLEHVVKSDDPASAYDRWTLNSRTMPGSLREWNIINVDDDNQLTEIWFHLRHETVVIDYFMNHFVFPKHARQFKIKLQASGWDLPLWSVSEQQPVAKAKNKSLHLTTGFSGTNDNRTLMPLTIEEKDLPGLQHTNAEVLTYLLQPRNRRYVLAADRSGKRISEIALLEMLYTQRIRTLIDAGAQILEMDNRTLVTHWLKIDWAAPAALYFDAGNKPFILFRHGATMPLLASPFAENIGSCLVYLDEAHTRGTDLKMPADAIGALTLGLGQTKDHTVQAAMRLRQLATTQSVVFFAPPEVNQSIKDFRKPGRSEPIDSADVIQWLIEQTCSGVEQLQPLYFSHGIDFCNRTQAASENPLFLDAVNQRNRYIKSLQQVEHQKLHELYAPRKNTSSTVRETLFCPKLVPFITQLHDHQQSFQGSSAAVDGSALEEVEQEREIAYEVESVREVQKPPQYLPLTFGGLGKAVAHFAETGKLIWEYGGFEHAFVALKNTSLGQKYGIRPNCTSSKFFVSAEFGRTVVLPGKRRDDNYLRQVTWVLWSTATKTALVITPEEVEFVLPILRDADAIVVHLLSYAAPVTRKMLHFNKLTYHAIPPLPIGWDPPSWLRIELGIFGARLYFSFDEYSDILNYLGTQNDDVRPKHLGLSLVLPQDDGAETSVGDEMQKASKSSGRVFCKKPLSFLQEWLAIKRKGQDFTHTPMGYLCQGRPLTANHPFFHQDDRVEQAAGDKVRGFWKAPGSADSNSDGAITDDDDVFDDIEDQTDEQQYGDDYQGDGAFDNAQAQSDGADSAV